MDLREHDDDTLIHEPRALWTIARVEAPASDATLVSAGRVEVDPRHFTNGSRYPMTLTKMLVAGIGYTYRQFEDAVVAIEDVHNSMVAANLVDIAVAAPYSVHWGPKDFRAMGLAPCPAAEPGFDLDPDIPWASGAWGVCRWGFDKLLWLPRNSGIQLDLSAYWLPSFLEAVDPQVVFAMSFDEVHSGLLGGNNRAIPGIMNSILSSQIVPAGLPQADAFGATVAAKASGVVVTYPTPFPVRNWNRQETNRGQDRNAFSAFSVLINQVAYDQAIQTVGGVFANQPIAPLSTRVVTRARCFNGGTNEWWWRPGAPLCLVAPTISPALVYNLPEPIVLGPGENLELEVQVPPGVLITPAVGSSIPALFQPTYQIGISFTGYASIEM